MSVAICRDLMPMTVCELTHDVLDGCFDLYFLLGFGYPRHVERVGEGGMG